MHKLLQTGLSFRVGHVGLGLALAVGLGACSTTRLDNTWAERTATPQSFALNKVVVVALVSDGVLRRATEDAMDNAISAGPRGQSGQLRAEPSYGLLNPSELGDVTVARQKVEAAGFDGAVLVSFVSSEQRLSVDAPMNRGGMWDHYGYNAGRMGYYEPVTVRTDTILKLQINVYSLAENRLLWSGVSSTLNPSKIEKLVVEVAEAVRGDLTERGLAP